MPMHHSPPITYSKLHPNYYKSSSIHSHIRSLLPEHTAHIHNPSCCHPKLDPELIEGNIHSPLKGLPANNTASTDEI